MDLWSYTNGLINLSILAIYVTLKLQWVCKTMLWYLFEKSFYMKYDFMASVCERLCKSLVKFFVIDRYDRISIYNVCSMIITLYLQAKTPINFWCKQNLNLRFFI